jgi:hypothetical protein
MLRSEQAIICAPSSAGADHVLAAVEDRHCGDETTVKNPVKAFALMALGLAIAAMGISVADPDDAPGAAVIGMVTTRRDSGIVVAVTSTMAHANTSSLALQVGDAFTEQDARIPQDSGQ